MRRSVVVVDVIDVPIEPEIGAIQHLRAAVRINGFQASRLSTVVHVRLVGQKPGRFRQGQVRIGPHVIGVGPDIDFIDSYRQGSNRVLRHVTFGIEFDAQGHVGGSLRAGGM